ncbi:ATPase, T2SS/T4P/T4SS family [Curtobacterium sp. MCPF17_052]|uniref:ATPase, T2SS/T4P/T4SS family n=1 Tax=Curtobacterium sp. MCPF17_052 TaxID=2175655 RepID=UPI0034649705
MWTDRGTGLTAVGGLVLSETRARDLARSLVARGGRHIDETTPCADVRHGDGIRVHAVLAPVSVRGTAISIRLPQDALPSIDRLVGGGFFERVPRTVVDRAVQERRNVLVTGATGSGKTTLLAAMLGLVPTDERIVTVEDVAELRIDHPPRRRARSTTGQRRGCRRARHRTTPPGSAADAARPDRRGGSVGAPRSGNSRRHSTPGTTGGAGTVHANGVGDVPARLEALGALAGLTPESLARQAASAFDLVLHVERRNGVRRLAEVGRLGGGPAGTARGHAVLDRGIRGTGDARPGTGATGSRGAGGSPRGAAGAGGDGDSERGDSVIAGGPGPVGSAIRGPRAAGGAHRRTRGA